MSFNPGFSAGRSSLHHFLLVFIILFSLALSVLIAKLPYLMGSLIVVSIAVFIACFVNTQFGLYLLIFSMLLSPEFGAGDLGGGSAATASRGVTIRLEDILLLILGFSWLTYMAVHKELGLIRENPLNGPIGYYIATFVVTTLIVYMTGYVDNGKTGFFFALKYIEYFVVYFIIVNNIQSRSHILQFTIALLLTALIVSVVAMAQIPSGGRVFAPFEGETEVPNTLWGYLLLLGSVATGLLLCARNRWVKILLGLLLWPCSSPLFLPSRAGRGGVLF